MVKFVQNTQTKEVFMVLDEAPLKENEVELKANTTDAAKEKHVPVIEQEGNKVKVTVGSVLHPMTEAHHISFIVLETEDKAVMKTLDPTGAPVAEFTLADGEKPVAAYEYCNLHGLWVKKA